MPLPIPLIAAGIQTVGQLGNMGLQGLQNAAMRRESEKLMNWQNDINLTNWGLQNQYNSPKEQMKRLKEAGLNPNLVYGNGGADTSAGAIGATSQPHWSPDALKFDAGAVLGSYFDTKIKQATYDNLEEQRKVIAQNALQGAAQTQKTLAEIPNINTKTDILKTQGQYVGQLAEASLEVAKSTIERNNANIRFTLDENQRKQIMLEPTFKLQVEKLLLMKKQEAKTDAEVSRINQAITNMKQDYRLKAFDEALQARGIARNSPGWFKYITDSAQEFLEGVADALNAKGPGTIMSGALEAARTYGSGQKR